MKAGHWLRRLTNTATANAAAAPAIYKYLASPPKLQKFLAGLISISTLGSVFGTSSTFFSIWWGLDSIRFYSSFFSCLSCFSTYTSSYTVVFSGTTCLGVCRLGVTAGFLGALLTVSEIIVRLSSSSSASSIYTTSLWDLLADLGGDWTSSVWGSASRSSKSNDWAVKPIWFA